MRSLTDFLKSLPGVMPRQAYSVVLEGDLLTETELADIHTRDNLHGRNALQDGRHTVCGRRDS
uniref:hypothetical protein n=1 Tax=Methylobacterium sp. B34 TaxID=95563 RepID=UPI000347B6B6|nr:hypothetical protein [Methylobacterium sp. B34]